VIYPELEHVGVVVPRLEPAVEQLSATFGLEFPPIMDTPAVLLMHRPNRDADEQIRIRASQSLQHPRVEVIEAVPGTPWALRSEAGFLLHHLAYWTDDLATDSRKISEVSPLQIYGVGQDGTTPKTFTYQLLEDGLLFELLEQSFSENGLRTVDPGCIVGI
jgi:hypothetical protein